MGPQVSVTESFEEERYGDLVKVPSTLEYSMEIEKKENCVLSLDI